MKKRLLTFSIILVHLFSLMAENELKMIPQSGHTDKIEQLLFTPDDKFVVTVSMTRIKLWDIISGKLVRTFIGGKKASISPDGKKIAYLTDFSDTVEIAKLESAEVINIIKLSNNVKNLSYSPDGKYLILSIFSSTKNGTETSLQIYDNENLKLKNKIILSYAFDTFFAFTPDKKYLLYSYYQNNQIENRSGFSGGIYNLETGKIDESDLAFELLSNDGKYKILANYKSGSYKYDLTLFDAITKKELKKIQQIHIRINYQITPDSQYLILENRKFDFTKIDKWDLRNFENDYGDNYLLTTLSHNGRFSIQLDNNSLNKVCLFDTKTNFLIKKFVGYSGIYVFDISPDSKSLIFSNYDKYLKSFNLLEEEMNWREKNEKFINPVSCVKFLSNDKIEAFTYSSKLYLYKNDSGKLLNESSFVDKVFDVSPLKKIIISSENNEVKIYNSETLELINKFIIPLEKTDKVKISNNGKYLLMTYKKFDLFTKIPANLWEDKILFNILSNTNFTYISMWDIDKNNELWTFLFKDIDISSIDFTPDSKYLALKYRIKTDVINTNILQFYNNFINKFELIHVEKGPNPLYGKELFSSDIKNENFPTAFCFSPDGKQLYTISLSGQVDVWDIDKHIITSSFKENVENIHQIRLSPDGKLLFFLHFNDSVLRIRNLKTGNSVSLSSYENDWIIYTDDGYYDGSNGCGNLIAMTKGMEVWNIDQFAPERNRPDIILQRMEAGNEELINHYYNQYKKRLKRLNMDGNTFLKDLHVPDLKFTEIIEKDKELFLKFNVNDSKYNLKAYNIYVNDVPIYGGYGKEIRGRDLEITDTVELSSGENKIEASCINEKGAESYRDLAYIDYNKNVKGDLYFIGFGVSNYKDKSLNLQFADRDVNDLKNIFLKMKNTNFSNVYAKSYIDNEVTVNNIKKAKEFLKNAKVDDTFVLFIAGHGIHDNDPESTYYFLTYETDINKLADTSVNFELIESLLQEIKPRYKLFLMDTCESGEIDNNMQNDYFLLAGDRELTARTNRGLLRRTADNKLYKKRNYLLKKDRFIYNDLHRRTGAIVFSSCKGDEFSYEKNEYKNGIFSEEILNALQDKNTDIDKNNYISINELKEFVERNVSDKSGDLQHPVIDRDNIYIKFGFPIIKP